MRSESFGNLLASRSLGALCAAALGLLALGPSSTARAEVAMLHPHLAADTAGALTASGDTVSVRCGDLRGDGVFACETVRHVTLACRADAPGAVTVRFSGESSDTIAVDGVVLTETASTTLDGVPLDVPSRHVPIAPGSQVDVVVRGTRPLRSFGRGLGEVSGLWARHVLLSEHPPVLRLSESIDPLDESLGPTGETTVHFELPEGWRLDTPDGAQQALPADQRLPVGGGLHYLVSAPSHEWDVRHGGPMLGVGGALSTLDGSWNFALRAGYEVGIGEFFLGSLTLDTDVQRSLSFALSLETALPTLLYIVPSVSAGAGLAVRALPDARAGLRLLLSAHFPIVGVESSFDYWPVDGQWTFTLLGRVSL